MNKVVGQIIEIIQLKCSSGKTERESSFHAIPIGAL